MIGIIGAMDEEVAILKESMESSGYDGTCRNDFDQRYYEWQGSCSCKSGIGKVNMGNLAAQILIDCFGVDTLINTVWQVLWMQISISGIS